MKTKTQTAWGVWVEWKDGVSEWGWDCVKSDWTHKSYAPAVFCKLRRDIMPLVRNWRKPPWVKRAVAKRIELPVPEGE